MTKEQDDSKAADRAELVKRLSDEAGLCRNEGADDIAALLDEAIGALARSTDATGEAIAYVPVHPKRGPLWMDAYDAKTPAEDIAERRTSSYPVMAVYATPPAAEDRVRDGLLARLDKSRASDAGETGEIPMVGRVPLSYVNQTPAVSTNSRPFDAVEIRDDEDGLSIIPAHMPAASTSAQGESRLWQLALLTAAARSGDEGTLRLAMQLTNCLPCENCDFVKSKCRCASLAATQAPAVPARLDAQLLGVIRTARSQALRIIAGDEDAGDLGQTKRDLPRTIDVIEHAVTELIARAAPAVPATDARAGPSDTQRLDWLLPNLHPATFGMDFPGGYEWDSDAEFLEKWRASIDVVLAAASTGGKP